MLNFDSLPYCRASNTGDAIRAGVSVGVVHVLCACAQVQSIVIPQLVTILPHLFVAFLYLFLLLLLLHQHSLYISIYITFLWTLKIVKGGVFAFF